jgi:hypothetical protein
LKGDEHIQNVVDYRTWSKTQEKGWKHLHLMKIKLDKSVMATTLLVNARLSRNTNVENYK